MNYQQIIPSQAAILPIYPTDIDDAKRMVRLKWADGNQRDEGGDITEISGLDLSRHRKNPVVGLEHFKEVAIPVGKCEDEKGNYTVILDPINKVALADVYFFKSDGEYGKLASEVFELVKQGVMRGASFGYMIKHAVDLPPDYQRGLTGGKHLLSVLVTEISIVSMPMNADTVRNPLPTHTRHKIAA